MDFSKCDEVEYVNVEYSSVLGNITSLLGLCCICIWYTYALVILRRNGTEQNAGIGLEFTGGPSIFRVKNFDMTKKSRLKVAGSIEQED
jgi:hypothetical protein